MVSMLYRQAIQSLLFNNYFLFIYQSLRFIKIAYGVNYFDWAFPLPCFDLESQPIPSAHCLKGLLKRNIITTVKITPEGCKPFGVKNWKNPQQTNIHIKWRFSWMRKSIIFCQIFAPLRFYAYSFTESLSKMRRWFLQLLDHITV